MQQFEDRIILQDIGQAQQIGGLADENIRLIEKRTALVLWREDRKSCWAVQKGV